MMKQYDIRFSQGYDRSHSWRYQQRVWANNEEEAKEIIINQCKKGRPDEKVMNIRVKEAQNFICWAYCSRKQDNDNYIFIKEYYANYFDLRPFGIGVQFSEKQEEAKRFQTEYELKEELKMLGRKISDFRIEKVEVNK